MPTSDATPELKNESAWWAVVIAVVSAAACAYALWCIVCLWPTVTTTVKNVKVPTTITTHQLDTSSAASTEGVGAGSESEPTKDSTIVSNTWTSGGTMSWTGKDLSQEVRGLWLVLLAGAVGACLHVLTSLAGFIGNRTFKISWSMWYLVRIPIGASLALLIVCLFRGGLITDDVSFDGTNPFQLVGLAGMAGLFSKHALDKLQDVFSTLLNSKENEKRLNNMTTEEDQHDEDQRKTETE